MTAGASCEVTRTGQAISASVELIFQFLLNFYEIDHGQEHQSNRAFITGRVHYMLCDAHNTYSNDNNVNLQRADAAYDIVLSQFWFQFQGNIIIYIAHGYYESFMIK